MAKLSKACGVGSGCSHAKKNVLTKTRTSSSVGKGKSTQPVGEGNIPLQKYSCFFMAIKSLIKELSKEVRNKESGKKRGKGKAKEEESNSKQTKKPLGRVNQKDDQVNKDELSTGPDIQSSREWEFEG
jgi:hypothetical protein